MDGAELQSVGTAKKKVIKKKKSIQYNIYIMSLGGYINPFNDLIKDDNVNRPILHLRIRKRSSKKAVTILQGLPENFDCLSFVRDGCKTMCCGGVIKNDSKYGKIIQFTGDNRKILMEYIIEKQLTSKDRIKIHGY